MQVYDTVKTPFFPTRLAKHLRSSTLRSFIRRHQIYLANPTTIPRLDPYFTATALPTSFAFSTRIKLPPSIFLISSGLYPLFNNSRVINGYVDTSSNCCGGDSIPSKSEPNPTWSG